MPEGAVSEYACRKKPRTECVALDTGYLDQTANRIAGHAEMMFERNLSGILDLRGRSATYCTQTCCGHCGGPDAPSRVVAPSSVPMLAITCLSIAERHFSPSP